VTGELELPIYSPIRPSQIPALLSRTIPSDKSRRTAVALTDNDKHEMDRFTTHESGECYVFDDDRIWHMLTPVAVLEGNHYTYRDTLALDMLPEFWEPVK
jgi:hypothetical protein